MPPVVRRDSSLQRSAERLWAQCDLSRLQVGLEVVDAAVDVGRFAAGAVAGGAVGAVGGADGGAAGAADTTGVGGGMEMQDDDILSYVNDDEESEPSEEQLAVSALLMGVVKAGYKSSLAVAQAFYDNRDLLRKYDFDSIVSIASVFTVKEGERITKAMVMTVVKDCKQEEAEKEKPLAQEVFSQESVEDEDEDDAEVNIYEGSGKTHLINLIAEKNTEIDTLVQKQKDTYLPALKSFYKDHEPLTKEEAKAKVHSLSNHLHIYHES
jgi:hypothetical protein